MAQLKRKQLRQEQENFERERERVSHEQLRHLQDMRSAFYAGVDPRRRREMADGGMVQEDRNAMANLSGVPIHREYPKDGTGFIFTPYLDDTREG